MRRLPHEGSAVRDPAGTRGDGVVTSRRVEPIPSSIIIELTEEAAQRNGASAVEPVVERPHTTAPCAAIDIIALVPFHRERARTIDAPHGLDILDRAIVAIKGHAEE